MVISRVVRLGFALLGTAAPLSAQATDSTPRVMTVDDLVKEEVFGTLAPQPSGQWIAVVTHPNWSGYEPVFGSHLTLVSRQKAEQLTIGERELSRFWLENVLWSPDGSQLAIVARSLGDGNSHLYIWDANRRTLKRVSTRPIGYWIAVGESRPAEIGWVSDTTLLYVELPDSSFATADKSPEDYFRFIAPRMWDRLAQGIQPTAYAVESGVADTAGVRSLVVSVVAANPRTDTRQVIATTAIPGKYRQLYFHVALRLRSAIVRVWDKPSPRRNVALNINEMWREHVGSMELRVPTTPHWFARDLKPGSTIEWAADGSTAVVTGFPFGASQRVKWMFDAATQRVDAAQPLTAHDSAARETPKQQRPVGIRLPAGARTVTDHPNERLTLYTMLTDSGYFAHALEWDSGRTLQLLALNRYIAGIKRGRRMMIDYRGNDGEALKGVVLLPPNYQAGRRYPVLTWVYAGNVFRTTEIGSLASDRPASSANMQVLAARDYVVLFPSIPMPDSGRRDQLLEMRGPVLAAVDRLVELGIADPSRVAVGGHSNGGYTTNVLVTQTNRFKAAISMAGMSNLTSVYGTFDPRFRYTDMASRDGTIQMYWAESGQALLGALQDNLWGYLRNSPVFYADRIQTPMLLLHGDQDFVSLGEAEQLFTSLYRLGKRARLVRYWGEGHLIGASPANTRNNWYEIFAWLDEFCDINRDANGRMVFEGDRPKSREGRPPLKPGDFDRFR